STVLYVPINQTGTYSLLAHTTLFGGNQTTESITLAAKFSNISSKNQTLQIQLNNTEIMSTFKNETNSEFIDVIRNDSQIIRNDSQIIRNDSQIITHDDTDNSSFNVGLSIGIGVGIAIGIVLFLILRQKPTNY
ncbi:MAG TPA: peptidase S8, partial [Nitrosarchaeum sp.]|nr:peptidase S8 [Nitrosarchaeum sp.]